MWRTPTFAELRVTLEDPSSPIGKRMRAAYYCKQLFQESEKNDDSATVVAPEIVDLLCEQLVVETHGSLLRHEFAYVLGQMKTTLACPTLEQVLTKKDDCVMVRHEAAEALGAIASPTSLPVLQTTYQEYTGVVNELADTCHLAAERIQNPMQVGCACMLAPYSSIDPADADPAHESVSTQELGNCLCDESKDLVERYRAMFSLRNRQAVEPLCRALVQDTSSPLLRHEVAFVLGQLQSPDSISALEESLSRSEEHVMVRHESAEALGAIDVTSSEQWDRIEGILRRYLQDEKQAVAESCVVALDAADYWGHNQTSEEQDTMNFGQHKRMDEQQQQQQPVPLSDHEGRKGILSQHFNVAP